MAMYMRERVARTRCNEALEGGDEEREDACARGAAVAMSGQDRERAKKKGNSDG